MRLFFGETAQEQKYEYVGKELRTIIKKRDNNIQRVSYI